MEQKIGLESYFSIPLSPSSNEIERMELETESLSKLLESKKEENKELDKRLNELIMSNSLLIERQDEKELPLLLLPPLLRLLEPIKTVTVMSLDQIEKIKEEYRNNIHKIKVACNNNNDYSHIDKKIKIDHCHQEDIFSEEAPWVLLSH